MAVIEGTAGPLLVGAAPSNGTDEVQTLTIDATGGTFKLEFEGHVTSAIAWNSTNNTLVANVNAALQGTAEVQTITFAATPSGTFRLRFKNQETATITWSSTNNTLVSNVDTALEALADIGASGVVTAAGVMTNGVGTLTVTFAEYGPQPLISVIDNRTGAAISASRTTAGTLFAPGGKSGIVAAVGTMTSGVGTLTLTFSGANMGKKSQPLITVADNSLTGIATLTVGETTPGVDATGRGLLPGGHIVDTINGIDYINNGTAQAPVYANIQTDEA